MKYFLPALLFCLVFDLLGGDEPITGTVRDAETKEPLPFANIVVSGQHRGTVSNVEGHFVLNREGIGPNDTIVFSYVGYEALRVRAVELQGRHDIYLHPAAVSLRAVEVYSRQLTAEEIIALVREHYPENYPAPSHKQRIFFHKYEKTPWPEENQIILKASDFVGMDRNTFDELFQKLPREFTEYQDALVELYSDEDDHKLVLVEGISLEEHSMQALGEEMEKALGAFLDDIQKSNNDPDIYYKFRTGIFAMKADQNNDSIWSRQKNDTLNYIVPTRQVKSDILSLLQDYADIESKNWEFINKYNRYDYALGDVTVFDDELVYEISFTPRKSGLFVGRMYVSTSTYAVLQLDFAYAAGKQSENFQVLGIGHSMNFKKGRVIFEKGKTGYFVKYIYAQQHESASIDRKFSVMKKKKRFLVDKELNEIKLEAHLTFDIRSFRELLVLERETIGLQQFHQANQPPIMKFRKEYAYTPEMWNDRTVIAPASELKKYKRRE